MPFHPDRNSNRIFQDFLTKTQVFQHLAYWVSSYASLDALYGVLKPKTIILTSKSKEIWKCKSEDFEDLPRHFVLSAKCAPQNQIGSRCPLRGRVLAAISSSKSGHQPDTNPYSQYWQKNPHYFGFGRLIVSETWWLSEKGVVFEKKCTKILWKKEKKREWMRKVQKSLKIVIEVEAAYAYSLWAYVCACERTLLHRRRASGFEGYNVSNSVQ